MLILLILKISFCIGGRILPDSSQPIELYSNNQGQFSSYTFYVFISTPINSEAFLSIEFPAEYTSGLGIVSCVSSETSSKWPSSLPCSVSGLTVTITMGELLAGSMSIKIEDVQNPSTSGGTGYFKLKTWKSSTVIDENSHFTSLGIAASPAALSVSLSVEGSLAASYSPIYKFTLNFSQIYREGTWMRVMFPSAYTTDSAECFLDSVTVTCYRFEDTNYVYVEFDDIQLLATTYILTMYNIQSPEFTGPVETIYVEIMEEDTYTALAMGSLSTPTILAGTISKIEISGDPLMRYSPGEYTITMRPTNTIPVGGRIEIEFPAEFQELVDNSCVFLSGLIPVNNYITCTFSGLRVSITGFKEVTNEYVTVRIGAINPSNSGPTSQFMIYTYNDSGDLIDQNEKAGFITISTIFYPKAFSLTLIEPKINNAVGEYGPIDLFLHPRTHFICDATDYLEITLELPSVVEMQAGEIACNFGEEQVPASLCTYSSGPPNMITIRTPTSEIYDCCPLSIKIDTAGTLPTGFRIPSTAYGWLTFVVRVYDSSGTQIEEAEFTFDTKPEGGNNISLDFLHHTRGSWNIFKFTVDNSIDIPQDGMIEVEFQTWNHSFPYDLGWDLKTFETHEFACIYESTFPGTPNCQIITGTTEYPVFVQFFGFSTAVSSGVPRWFWLPGVLNGEYASFTPYLTFRTKDPTGIVLEEKLFVLPELVELPDPLAYGFTVSTLDQDIPATSMSFSLPLSAPLEDDGQIYFAFPRGYKWDFPNFQGVFTEDCTPFEGAEADYREFTQHQSAGILYMQNPGDSIPNTYQTCFYIDYQSLWYQSPVIQVYVVKDYVVRDYYEVQNGQIATAPDIILTGVQDQTDLFDIESTNLWKLIMTTTERITEGGSIQVHYPVEYWDYLDEECYKVYTPGWDVKCKGENNYDSTYHRIILYDFVPDPQLNPPFRAEAWFYATTGLTTGTATVLVFSQDEDKDTDKKIEYEEFNFNIEYYYKPTYAEIDYHTSNLVEAYASTPTFTEWGTIKLVVTSQEIFPEATTLYKTLVIITFPWDNTPTVVQYFPKNPTGLIQCRANQFYALREHGYFGRHCKWIEGPPDRVEFFIPKEVRFENDLLFEIELSTTGATNPLENGFAYPEVPGDYRFIMYMVKNDDAHEEQSEAFMYVQESRLTDADITSENKVYRQPNIMRFNFKPTTNIPSSDNPLTPARIFFEFPFDTGNGRGFKYDLGTGIADGGKMDCHQDGGNTVIPITGTELTCTLRHGFVDYVTIEVSNFQAITVGSNDNFNLYFGCIYNSDAALYDYWIRIRTVYEDINDIDNPSWVTLDTQTVRYVETSYGLIPDELEVDRNVRYHPTDIERDYNTVTDPVRFVPGVDDLTVSFNIQNAVTDTSGHLYFKLPTEFELPDDYDDLTISIIKGTEYDTPEPSCTPLVDSEMWRESRFIKLQNCQNLELNVYTPDNPGDVPYTPNRVTFYPLKMPAWPVPISFTFESWVVQDRKTTSYISEIFPTAYMIPQGACQVVEYGTTDVGDFGGTELYNFRFACENEIPFGGEYIIFFPREFVNGTIDAVNCEFSTDTDATLLDAPAACTLFRDIELHINNLITTVPPNAIVDVSVNVTNPPQGTMPNPHQADRYTIASYDSVELEPRSFNMIDLADPVGFAWLSDPLNKSLEPPTLEQDESIIFYLEPLPLVDPGTAPLVFQLQTATAVTMEVGYLTITTEQYISIPNNAELRCVWLFSGVEYLAHDCVGTYGVTNVIQVFAPKYDDVPASTAVQLTITTVFADDRFEGIQFRDNLIEYAFDFALSPTGGAVSYMEKRYVNQVPDGFPGLSISADCWTQAEFTRMIVSFQIGTTVIPDASAGGRLVIELPTVGLFANDLGLGLQNNDAVDCQGSDSLTPGISCYIFLGDGTTTPAKIVVTDFNGVSSSADTYSINLPYIFNPTTGGDDVSITVTVYAHDTSVYPPLKLYYRTVPMAWRVKTNVPVVNTAELEPTVSVNTLSSPADYTFTVSTILEVDSYLVLSFPSLLTHTAMNPTCVDDTTVTQTCVYYSSSNKLIITAANDFTSITVQSLINPSHPLSPSELLQITGYIWTEHELIERIDYPIMTETFSTATPGLLVTTPGKPSGVLLNNDHVEYLIEFTTSKQIPDVGLVRVDFPTEFPALPTTVCNNYHPGVVSQVASFTCTISGNSLEMIGFDTIAAGDTLAVKVLAQHPNTSLTTATGITVSSFFTTSGLAADLIESAVDTALTISTSRASPFYTVPRQHAAARLAISTEYAVIKLRLQGFGTFTASTGYMNIDLGISFGTIPLDSEMVCLWETTRSDCTITGSVVTVYAPDDSNWTNSDFLLTVTTTNAQSIDRVGIQIVPTQGEHSFQVDADYDGDSTIDAFSVDFFHILPVNYLNDASVTSGQSTASAKNLFTVSITTNQAIPAGGYIRIYFPTTDQWQNQIFLPDLGTGLSHGDIITCQPQVGETVLVPRFGDNIHCRLYQGQNYDGKPSFIEITNFNAIAGSAQFELVIWGIINPASPNEDRTIVHMWIVTLNDGYQELDSLEINYVSTIAPAITSDPGTPVFPYNTPVLSAGTVGTTVTIDLHLMDNVYAITTDTVYLLEIPAEIPMDGMTVAGGTVYEQMRLVEYPSAPAGTANSHPIVQLTTGVILEQELSSAIITCYQWENGLSVRDGNDYLPFASFSLNSFSNIAYVLQTEINRIGRGVIDFDLTTAIPAGGSIKITFPVDYDIEGNDCELNGLAVFSDFICHVSGRELEIELLETVNSGRSLSVSMYLKYLTDTADPITIESFSVYPGTSGLELATFVPPTIVATDRWPLTIQAPPQSRFPHISPQSDLAQIRFKLNPSYTVDHDPTKYVDVSMGTAFASKSTNAQVFCTLNSYLIYCEETTPNQVFRLYASQGQTFTAGNWHEITIYTHGADLDNNGFEQPAVFLNTMTVLVDDGTNTETETVNLEIPTNKIAKFIARPLHYTQDSLNVFEFLIETTATVDGSAGDYIEIEFPYADYDGNILFRDDLGSGKASGEEFYCDNFRTIADVAYPDARCILLRGDLSQPPRLIVVGTYSFSTDGMKFEASKIRNPQTSGSEVHVNISIKIISSGDTIESGIHSYVMNVVPDSSLSLCTSVAAPTLSDYSTSGSASLTLTCCSRNDLLAGDYYIIEYPEEYPIMATSITSGPFDAIEFSLSSSRWLVLSTSTGATCKTAPETIVLGAVTNPTYQIAASTLVFNGLAISSKDVTDNIDYAAISTAIDRTVVVNTCTVAISSLTDRTSDEGLFNLMTLTFTCDNIIAVDEVITIDMTSTGTPVLDPYYFTGKSGVADYDYTLTGSQFAITNLAAIPASTAIAFEIGIQNPQLGQTVTYQVSVMGGSDSVTSVARTKPFASNLSLQAHNYRVTSISSTAEFSMDLQIEVTAVDANHDTVFISFDCLDGSITASTNVTTTALFDGSPCTAGCTSAIWTSSSQLEYSLDIGTVTAGIHTFTIVGDGAANPLRFGTTNICLVTVRYGKAAIVEVTDILYTIALWTASEDSTFTPTHVGRNSGESGMLFATFDRTSTATDTHLLLFEFEGDALVPDNSWVQDLGTGNSDGSMYPGSLFDTSQVNECYLRISTSSLRSGVLCRRNPGTTSVEAYLMDLTNPVNAVTVYFNVVSLYRDSTGHLANGMGLGTSTTVVSATTTATGTVTLGDSAVQASTSWDISDLIDPTLASGDYVLVTFNNFVTSYDLTTFASTAGITSHFAIEELGFLIIELSSNSPSFNMNNPFHVGTYDITAYSYVSGILTSIETDSAIGIVAGTHTAVAFSTFVNPTLGIETAFDMDITLAHTVPTDGIIRISFPTAFFTSIDCSYCSSNLSDKDLDNLVTFTVTTPSAIQLDVTNFSTVAASVVTITGIRGQYVTTGTATVTVDTYASGPLDIATGSSTLTIVTAPVAPLGIVRLPYCVLFRGFRTLDKSDETVLTFLYQPRTTVATTDRIEIDAPWLFTATSSLGTDDFEVVLINGSLASCTSTGSVKSITPPSTMTTGQIYKLEYFTRFNDAIPLAPSTDDFHSVTVRSVIGGSTFDSGTIDILLAPIFSEFRAVTYAQGSGQKSLLEVTIVPSVAVVGGNSGELIFEFTLFDLESALSIFSQNIGDGTSTSYPCEMFTSSTGRQAPVTGIYCAIIYGYTVGTDTTQSTKIVLTLGSNSLTAGSTYIIGFPGIEIPSSTIGPDMLVYSKEYDAILTAEVIKEYIYFQKVMNNHQENTVTTSNFDFQSNITPANLSASPVSFDLIFTPLVDILNTDKLVFIYDPENLEIVIASLDITSPAYNSLHLYPTIGWMVYQPSATISTVSTTVSFNGFKNPDYLSTTPTDYVIEARHFNRLTDIRTPAIWENTYVFDQNIPNPVFLVGVITPSALGTDFGCLLCIGTTGTGTVFADQEAMYKFTFQYDSNIVDGGSVGITIPAEFQSVAKTCEAISAGFSDTTDVQCTDTGSMTLLVNNFGGYTANNDISIYVRARNPSIAHATTSTFDIFAANDASGVNVIGSDSSRTFIVTGRTTIPATLGIMNVFRKSEFLAARESVASPLVLEFILEGQLSAETASLTVTVPAGSFAPTDAFLYCSFIDTNGYEYGATSCSYASDVFTVFAPRSTDIADGVKWQLKIHSHTGGGLTYPASGWHAVTVVFPSEQFEYNILVVPSAANRVRVYPFSHTVSFTNTFQVELEGSIQSYISNAARIEVEFPADFLVDLGTGQADREAIDCDSDLSILPSTTLECTLTLGEYLTVPYRPRLPKITLHNQDNNVGVIRKVFPINILNTATASLHVPIHIRVYEVVTKVETPVIDEMIYFTMYTRSDSSTTDMEDSYLNTMAPDAIIGTTGVTFNVQTNLGAAVLSETDYMIWRFPYGIDSAIVITENASSGVQDEITEDIMTHDTLGVIVTAPPTGVTYTGNVQWDFSNFVNPNYVPLTDPVLSVDIIIENKLFKTVQFDQNLLNHQAGPLTVNYVRAGDASNDGYINGRIDFNIEFTAPGTLNDPVITIGFPGFTLDPYCEVFSALTVAKGDWVDCMSSGTDFLLSNIGTYTSGQTIQVRGWVTVPGTVGPHTISLNFFSSYPSTMVYTASHSYTANATPGFAELTVPNFVYRPSDIPVLINENAPMSFTVEVPAVITMEVGFLTVNYESSSFDVTAAACAWDNGSVVWQASFCNVTSTVDALTLKVFAPEYNDITVGTWNILVSSLGGTTVDGITFPSTGDLQNVYFQYSADGAADEELISFVDVKVPEEYFSSGSIFTYNELKNTPILFELSLTPLNNYGTGVPQILGTTYLRLKFPTVYNSITYFGDDLGTAYDDATQYPCYSVLSMNNLLCMLVLGDSLNSVEALLFVYDYTDAFNTNQHRFYVPWLYNPVDSKVNLFMTVELWDSAQLKVSKTFKYIYATLDETPVTTTIPISYSSILYGGSGDIDFTFALTNALTNQADEKIVWNLLEDNPAWTTNICTPAVDLHTCDLIQADHRIITNIGSAVGATDVVTLESVPNPVDPSAQQNWEIYIFKNSVLQDVMDAGRGTFPYSGTVDYLDVVWHKPDANVPNPLISRYDRYTFSFKPSQSLLAGYRLLVNFPGGFSPNTDCNILHGLSGNGMRCTQRAAPNLSSIECTDFDNYYPYYVEIVIACLATNPGSATTTGSFSAQVLDNFGTIIATMSSASGFTIDSAPQQFSIMYMGICHRSRALACEDKVYTDLWLNMIPQHNHFYGNVFYVYLPTGVTYAGGTLQCMWHRYANSTPTRHYCRFDSANRIRVEVTEQLAFRSNREYALHIYSRDSAGGLGQTGFVVPAAPGYMTWYFRVGGNNDGGDGLKIRREVCPIPFNNVDIKFYSFTINRWTILDFTFNPTIDIPIGGGVAIEFPTYNEIEETFQEDLGLQLKPLEAEMEIGCRVLSGFGSPSPGVVKCKVERAYTVDYYNPAIIKIYNHDAILAHGQNHIIRIVKIMMPVMIESPILYEPFFVHFNFWSYNERTNDFNTDARRLNLETKLNVIDFNTDDRLYEANPAVINEAAPTTLISKIWTVITDEIYTEIDLQTNVNTTESFVIYEFDDSFVLPVTGTTDILCNGSTANCQIYKESYWVVWRTDQAPINPLIVTFEDSGSSNFRSPSYEKPGYAFSTYVIDNREWREEHIYADLAIFNRGTLTVGIAHRLTTLHRSTYDVWTFTITPEMASEQVKRIDIHFPPEFQWVDTTCLTTLTITDENINPISCTSDCDEEVCTNHITITNFLDTSAASTIEVEIGAMNPSTAGTTSDFRFFYYGNLTDTTRITEDYVGGALTIDSIIYPYDYWIELPTKSIYDREVEHSSYGELWIRFKSRITLPSSTGWYMIVLPEEFDISPSADLICTIVHTDIPFDNFRDRYTKDYFHVRVPKCVYSFRTIDLFLPDDILREFYGVELDICTYLVITTEKSIITGTEGFRSPLQPGCYTIEFYAHIGPAVVESALSDLCILGTEITTYSVEASTIDTAWNAIYEISMTTATSVPPGYYYSDGTYAGTQATMVIELETYESFATNLAGQHEADLSLYCQAISGISANGSLHCQVTYGSVSTNPFVKVPVKIEVTNFHAIAVNTPIEFHIPVLQNPATDGWVPQVTFGIYTVDYENTVIWIADKTTVSLTAVAASIASALVTGKTFTVTLPELKAPTTIVIDFQAQTASLGAGSKIVIEFPEPFTTIPESGVTAYIIKKTPIDITTNTYIVADIEVVTYPTPRIVTLTIPTGKSVLVGEDVEIQLFDFVNPNYITNCGGTCTITYYSIDPSKRVLDQYETGDIFTLVTYQSTKFSVEPVGLSSPFANSTNAEVTFNVSPNLGIDSSMTTTISFPSSFPDISTISPQPTCTISIGTCSISGNAIVFTGAEIAQDTDISISVSGVVMPSSATEIPQRSTGFTIESIDGSSNTVMYTEFPAVKIYDSKPVTKIQPQINPRFSDAEVFTDYTFTLNTMKGVTKGTNVKIVFPVEYIIINADRCFLGGGGQSYQSCTISGNEVDMVINENVPRFQEFTIMIPYVRNPAISIADSNGGMQTSAFEFQTSFSGIVIDESDIADPACLVYIKAKPSTLTVTSLTITPTTEGETALYRLLIDNPMAILGTDNIGVYLLFPLEFSYDLIRADLDLSCTSTPTHSSCTFIDPKLVYFAGLSSNTTTDLDLSVFAISNPIAGTTSDTMKVYYYNETSDTVLYYNEATTITITGLPSVLNMTSISCTSGVTHSSGTYSIIFRVDTVGIDANGGILLDWPSRYQNIFHQSLYSCHFGTTGMPTPVCNWIEETQYRRTQVALSTDVASGFGEIKLELTSVPTPQLHGETQAFALRLIDSTTRVITARSYPNLTPQSTLIFNDVGYRIFSNSSHIELYPGSYSYPINMSLEEPSYAGFTLEPVSLTSGIYFEPPVISFHYVQKTSANIRVYAPSDTPPGTYQVTWQKSEDITDEKDREYKHLYDIFVEVKEPEPVIAVFCEDISYVPIGGSSLPIKVWLDKPAYSKLIINLSSGSYVTIQPSSLVFAVGHQEHYFEISLTYGAVSGTVNLELSGQAAEIYYLTESSKDFQTREFSSRSPEVRSSRLVELTRVSAKVMVQVSDISKIYYMYTRKGTSKPTSHMLKMGESSWSDAETVFGSTQTSIQNGIGYIEINGLTDDTEYELYFVVENREHHVSLETSEVHFKTLPKLLPTKFRIYVSKASTVDSIRLGVAKALGVDLQYVLHTGVDPGTENSGDIEIYYELTLYVGRTDVSYTPIYLVRNLGSDVERAQKFIPFYLDSHPILEYASEYSYLMPEFEEDTQLFTAMDGTVNVDIGLKKAGTIYAIILGADKRPPCSAQIRDGLNSHNLLVKESRKSHQTIDYGERAYLNFTGLTIHEEMVVYITAENNLPGNPDLMRDEYVAALPIIVGIERDDTYYYNFHYLNSALVLVVQLILLTLV